MVMKATAQTKSSAYTIAAGEFKAKCLRLMDDAVLSQESFTITKRGKVIGDFVPVREERAFRSVVGRSPGIKVFGDIISPLPQELTLPEWAWEKPKKATKKKAKKK